MVGRASLAYWFLTCSLTLMAQVNETHLYTVADGLPYTENQLVHVDYEGYLWVVGTNNKLARFDGIKFEEIEVGPTMQNYLFSETIVSDAEGTWFVPAVSLGYICLYAQGHWTCYQTDSIYYFHDRQKNTLTGYSRSGDLYHFNKEKNNWTKFTSIHIREPFIESSFHVDKVIQGPGYYFYYQNNDREVFYYQLDSLTQTTWHNPLPTSMVPDQDPILNGEVILSTQAVPDQDPKKNLFLCLTTANGLKPAFYVDKKGNQIPMRQRGNPARIEAGLYYIANKDFSNESDLYQIFRYEGGQIFSPVATFRSKIPHLSFTKDKSGNFWIAGHGGILKVNPYALEFYDDQPNMIAALHNINEDKFGNIWFGGYKTGMSYYDGNELKRGGVDYIRNIMPGSYHSTTGAMLFFDEIYGLVKYDGINWEFSGNFKFNTHNSHATGYFLKEISENRLAMGLSKKGVGLLPKPFDPTARWTILGEEKGFKLGNVITLAEDRNKRIWMGRSSTGIAVYDPPQDTIINWLVEDYPLLKNGFRSCLIDQKGNMWIGKEGGLFFLEAPHEIDIHTSGFLEKIIPIPILEAGDGIVSQFMEVDKYLIFANNLGHGFLDLETYYADSSKVVVYFYNTSGPNQGGAAEQNAIFKDSKGYIWLGKDRGALRIDMKNLNLDTAPVYLIIDSIKAGDENLLAKNGTSYKLPTAKRNLQIWYRPSFTGQLTDPVTFQYRLLHARDSSDLIYAGKTTQLSFSYLPPGRNRLEIQALKNNQVVDEKSLDLYVPQTLAENTWFWVGLLGSLFLLGGGFLYYEQRQRLNIRQKELELSEARREKEKLQIAAIANSLNPHFINNSLSWLQWALVDDQKGIQVVSRLAENIKTVFKKSREGQPFHSLADEIKLVENYLTIQQIRYEQSFHVTLPNPEILQKWQDIQIPLMQIQIHVENAIEHGLRNDKDAHLIKIDLQEEIDDLHIRIIDDGIGRKRAREIHSSGTGEGTEMLEKMHEIYNQKNARSIKSWYEDDPFEKENGIHHGTIVHILLPKIYTYDLGTH